MQNPLVLASTSPFRKELLQRLNINFVVASPHVDETMLVNESPAETAQRLSELKAKAVSNNYPDALIIGSDQVAHIGMEVFGKPGNHEKAIEQLHKLSGKTVNFISGLCLYNTKTKIARTRNVVTKVTFRYLDALLIERYLRLEQPYNCAGSAKSEGLGLALIAKMECDDPTALVGLPLIALCDLLAEEGISAI